jgi:perosamine synthetase
MHEALTRKIPVSGPWITEHEVGYVTDAARTAWQENAGVYHERFEAAFAQWVGRRHALALPSCTSALHLALAAMDVGADDEVIVPEITWIASAAPIVYVGATPVLADVDPSTWCLCPESFRRAITPRTRAVIAVDVYGAMPDMAAIERVAAEHGVDVIEDAAEAVGSEQHGRRAGSFGRAGAFSFHGSKTLTTGEGGMLVTDDDELLRRCLHLRDHGRPPGDTTFRNTEFAFKYRMSAMQAALGLAQLERADEIVERKRAIHGWYADDLGGIDGLRLNPAPPGGRSGYWMVTATWDERFAIDKDGLAAELAECGIDTRPFFHPLSSLPACRDLPSAAAAPERNPAAYALAARGLNLPSGLQLTRDDVRFVSETLGRILGNHRNRS